MMNFELIKKHPYTTGGVLVGVFLLVYLYRKFSGGGSTPSGNTYVNGLDPQTAAIEAAASQQQLASQTQIAVATQNAQTMAAAIAAQQETTDKQTAAALAAAQAQYGAATTIAKAQFGAQNHTADDAVKIVGIQGNTTIKADTINSSVAKDYIAFLTQYTRGQQSLSKTALADVGKVNGSQNRTSIIESAMGNVQGSVAAENGQTASSISGDKLLSSVTSTISSVFSGLFG